MLVLRVAQVLAALEGPLESLRAATARWAKTAASR
jgi:hypothetical protein